MNFDESRISARHFGEVANLARRLALNRLAIYQHKFSEMDFGSWEIVAGRRRRMLRFSYDGKESCLSYSDVHAKPPHLAELQHRQFSELEGNEPLNVVAEVLEKEFLT